MVSPLVSPVDSSAIDRIAYRVRGRKLFVTFRAGTYTYFDVPPEAYEAFMASPSKGSFFATEIRNRYDFKVPQGEAVNGRQGSPRGGSPFARSASRRARSRR